MPTLTAIHFRPPLAFARLGGSAKPVENYEWRDDPSIHGAARTVVEPATSLELLANGTMVPYRPALLQFADGDQLRPVAPFFELWATAEWEADDPEVTQGGKKPGTQDDVALTNALLQRAGGSLGGVLYSVHVANRKAARRTGDDANSFEAQLQVKGDCFERRELLAATTPRPGQVALVSPERPIPLGWIQVVRPLPRTELNVDLDVLRVRFTPARGQVYGPPTTIDGAGDPSGRVFTIVRPENRVLNPEASWLRYDASYANFANPEPSDTYDGADQDAQVTWGVVDDTCDGLITALVVARARRLTARARVSVGPPDYAPDRRPFVSLADDLSDRDLEPPTVAEIAGARPAAEESIADLFARVFETARLINVDVLRTRAIGDNQDFILSDFTTRVATLPATDYDSMTVADAPYADDKIREMELAGTGSSPTPPPPKTPTPYAGLVQSAHDGLAELDSLLEFLRSMPDRVRQMLRPAYGAFAELRAIVNNTDEPDPNFRDPRIDRDQAHDMRMPPYMRDELATALSLTRRQYLEVMRYLDVIEGAAKATSSTLKILKTVAPAVAASPPLVVEQSPLRARIVHVVGRLRANRRPDSGE